MTTLSARIVTELCRVKSGAREALPEEWFRRVCKGRLLSEVPTPWAPIPTWLKYIGPDLTLPENLHNLFAVADALACLGVDVSYNADANNYDAHISGPDFECLGRGHGPTRTAALLAAVCAALGIEEVL